MGLKIYRLLCRLLRGLCPLNCSGTRYALLRWSDFTPSVEKWLPPGEVFIFLTRISKKRRCPRSKATLPELRSSAKRKHGGIDVKGSDETRQSLAASAVNFEPAVWCRSTNGWPAG